MGLRTARIVKQGSLSGFPCAANNQLRSGADKGDPIAKLQQNIAMASEGVAAMRFLPSVLIAKVMKLKQARVNGGSTCDS